MSLRDQVHGSDVDWNALFLANGAALFELARELAAGSNAKDRALGIRIARESLFEEERENPEAITWVADAAIDLAPLVAALTAALPHDADAAFALFALARHGADVRAAGAAMPPLFAKDQAKALRVAALAVFVHACGRAGRIAEVLPHLKGNAPLKAALFEELIVPAARGWDVAPVLALAVKDLEAKSANSTRAAVDVLWELVRGGIDISPAMAILEAKQVYLAGFTNSSQVIAGELLRRGDRAALAAWIGSGEKDRRVCAYRGLRLARNAGLDASIVFGDRKLVAELQQLAADPANRLPALDE